MSSNHSALGWKPCAANQRLMVKPQDSANLVVEVNGNQWERPTAETFRSRLLLEQTVEEQINQMKTYASTLESMRANLNRLQAALVPLETDLSQEQPDAETVDEVHRLAIDGEDKQTVEEPAKAQSKTVEGPAKAQPEIQSTAKTMCVVNRSEETRPSRWTCNRRWQSVWRKPSPQPRKLTTSSG